MVIALLTKDFNTRIELTHIINELDKLLDPFAFAIHDFRSNIELQPK
jgi:hypothetical protein